MTDPLLDLRTLKRAVFARHSNPWSAWTRWASAPLVLVPVWRRSWRDAALVGAWMALNPVVFPRPAEEQAWATRAVLGEEQWIARRPLDLAMAVDVAAAAAALVAVGAAYQRRAMPAAAATALEMGLLMAYWELMARYYDRSVGVRHDLTAVPTARACDDCRRGVNRSRGATLPTRR
jgi:hypothetical protein